MEKSNSLTLAENEETPAVDFVEEKFVIMKNLNYMDVMGIEFINHAFQIYKKCMIK